MHVLFERINLFICLVLVVSTICFIKVESSKVGTIKPIAATKSIPYSELRFIKRDNQDNVEIPTLVGSDVILDCRVEGFPQPNITWLKNEMPLAETSYRYFKHNMEKVFTLVLKNLLVADAGKYKCTADNGISKSITTSIRLVVHDKPLKGKPQINYISPKNVVVRAGKRIKFFCKAKHVRDAKTPFIKWIRYSSYNATTSSASNNTNTSTNQPTLSAEQYNDTIYVKRLSNITHIKDGMVHQHIDLKLNQCEESYYEIKSATLMDSGEYSCMVFNGRGYAKETAYLTVLPVRTLTKAELEEKFVAKYGSHRKPPFPLAVIVGLPVFLLVILIIGCVYVHETQHRSYGERVHDGDNSQVVTAENYKKRRKPIIPQIILQSASSGDDIQSDMHSKAANSEKSMLLVGGHTS